MKRKRYSEEQSISILKRYEACPWVADIARRHLALRGEDQSIVASRQYRCGTRSKCPKRWISASFSAAPAVLALPTLDKCDPNSSRPPQSNTNATWHQRCRPHQTIARSIVQRSLIRSVTAGRAFARSMALGLFADRPALKLADTLHNLAIPA